MYAAFLKGRPHNLRDTCASTSDSAEESDATVAAASDLARAACSARTCEILTTYMHNDILFYIYTNGTCAQARSHILINNMLSTIILPARGRADGRTEGGGRTDGRREGGRDGQLKAYEL